MSTKKRMLLLFDCDGTLTKPRNDVTPDMLAFMKRVRGQVAVGVVGGSDYDKIREQLTVPVEKEFDYVFSQNGLVAYADGKLLATSTLKSEIKRERLNELITACLQSVLAADVPVRRGTFVEFRSGMLNVSPIGRNCSQEERDEFGLYDAKHGVRAKMVAELQPRFPEFKFSIGGQISFDVFPRGWDKTFCLRFVEGKYDEIHFWGDKTEAGGNDYEIFVDPRVRGHTTTSPDDTRRQVAALLGIPE